MQLLIDIGNSRIKWNTAQHGQLQGKTQAFIWHLDQLADELLQQWQPLPEMTSVWIANVAGNAVAQVVEHFCQHHWRLMPQYARTASAQCGITNAYHQASHLGVDRWLCLLAAGQRYPRQPICVISCGTALTVDFINAKGEHLGGAIAPGPQLMQTALRHQSRAIDDTLKLEQAAETHLPDKDSTHLSHAWQQVLTGSVGRSTQECIAIGVRYASLGFVDAMIDKAQRELTTECRIIMTGGDAEYLIQQVLHEQTAQKRDALTDAIRYEPDLLLHGLLMLGNDNVGDGNP